MRTMMKRLVLRNRSIVVVDCMACLCWCTFGFEMIAAVAVVEMSNLIADGIDGGFDDHCLLDLHNCNRRFFFILLNVLVI